MSAQKVLKAGHCNDCKQPHGRPAPSVSLCFPCRTERARARGRTERSLETRRRYNRSPKGKLNKSKWEDAYRQRRHDLYKLRYKKLQSIWTCEATLCTNTFIRVVSSHRQFCDVCAAAFFGQRYVNRRAMRVAKYLAA